MNFIICIILGITTGWLTGKLIKCRRYGLFCDLTLGASCGLIGALLFCLLNFNNSIDTIGSSCLSIIGAFFLIWSVNLMKKKSDEHKRIKKIFEFYFSESTAKVQS